MRDLRRHFVAVLTIGIVIAIGIGVYAGFGSTATWRRATNDASFTELRMHDLRVSLGPGTFLPAGELDAAARSIAGGSFISATTERLIVDAQIDASTDTQTILVPARIIGTALDDPDAVDQVWVSEGNVPTDDPDMPAVLLETKFADHHGLPTSGSVVISGGRNVAYEGFGIGPEEFYVVGQQGSIMAEADFANVYSHLATAQSLAARSGDVNDLVLTLAANADRDAIQEQLEVLFDDPRLGLAADVTTRDDVEAYRVLYEDIDNDQRVWNALSALVLLSAALAAFNLISRIVEAQRREIGIGMALGLPRRQLAIRPVLVGVQVGVVGTILGIGAGLLIGTAMRNLLQSFLPMPTYVTPFQPSVFIRGAVLGVVPPLLASVLPVWRAVRVEPIEAIRTGHLAASGGRLSSRAGQVRLPGTSLSQMPLRNVLRAPRRTVLTAVGVGAAITALVGTLGLLDTFTALVDRGAAELTKGNPERVSISLDTFYAFDAPEVVAIIELPAVGDADPTLRLPGTISTPGHEDLSVLVELIGLDHAVWSPTIATMGADGPESGLILAEKAAADLGVAVGDTVSLRHPRRDGGRWSLASTPFVVAALHPNPIRNFAFLDESFASEFGMDGMTNALQTVPAEGFSRGDLQRAVFAMPAVASAQPVARVGEAFDEMLEQFVGFFMLAAGAVLVLALLIAVNSSRISVEERRREHATMLAFGIRPRTVIGLVVREAVLVGVLATMIGIVGGLLSVQWMIDSITERSLPDIAIELSVSWTTYLIAATVGIAAVALAPLFLVRRIRRMNLPDTLRVME